MAVTSADCKQYIVDWYKNNPGVLPRIPALVAAGDIDADGCCGGMRNGLNLADWKRCAKVAKNGKVYRAFRPDRTTLDFYLVVVLTEENGNITDLEYGYINQFEGPGNYFEKIKF